MSEVAKIRSVGRLPDTRVSALLFGFLPVAVTLHLTQRQHGAKVTPITARQFAEPMTVVKGIDPTDIDNPNFRSCDDDWSSHLPATVVARGDFDVRLSNLSVDGHRVDIGNRCTTTAPTELRANGNEPDYGGQYGGVVDGGLILQQLNRLTVQGTNPARKIKLFPGAINLAVAPFSGCRNTSTGEDLSTLLTKFISGSQNTATLNQGKLILNNTPGTDKPNLCISDDAAPNGTRCANDPMAHPNPVPPGK